MAVLNVGDIGTVKVPIRQTAGGNHYWVEFPRQANRRLCQGKAGQQFRTDEEVVVTTFENAMPIVGRPQGGTSNG